LTAQHAITTDIPETLPPLPVDYVHIGQVLFNLVENAMRYTPPGTAIAVSARAETQSVVIRVADDGPGIPAQALPHIFEKFYRVSGGDRAPVPGTGLGLAIARGLVEAHGGRIAVESPAPGSARGAVFTITLPLDAPVADRTPASAPANAALAERDAA
jgi:two-component system sensor histidine kinase KdpD